MDLGLDGKVALVTGASAGLGYAAAQALYSEGARLAICSRDQGRIDKAADSISDKKGEIYAHACDLEKPEDISELIGAASSKLGSLDILVANCGGPPTGRHDDMTEESWLTGYKRTFMSAIRLIQAAVPQMKQNKFGRIVLITSMSAKQPIDNLLLSNSYRAGLLGYAKTISRELAAFGITVNTVLPGFTETERLEDLAVTVASDSGKSRDDVYSDWIATIPVGRLGQPDELGQLVAYLSGANSGYITGAVISIDGGRSAGIL